MAYKEYSVSYCTINIVAGGLCRKHYTRFMKYGDADIGEGGE